MVLARSLRVNGALQMANQFVSARLDRDLQRKLLQLPSFPEDLRHCLIIGPERSGRTAVLFHYAHSLAAAGQHVVFITRRAAVDLEPPVLPAGVAKDDEAFSRIRMRYLETLTDVKKYASALHLAPQPPAAIIVDDLSKFEDTTAGDRQLHDKEFIATLGYLKDATQWAGKQRGDNACTLLLSETSSSAEGPHRLFLFQRWCPLMLQITAVGDVARLMPSPVVFDQHEIDPANCVGLDFAVAKHSALSLEAITRLT